MYFIFQCSLKMAHEEVLSALLAITEKKNTVAREKKIGKYFKFWNESLYPCYRINAAFDHFHVVWR